MYKPPLPEDDAPHDIPEFSYPPRRRKEQKSVSRPLARKRAPEDYNEDERPGEPITRRASLLREKQQQKQQNQTSSETSQHETTEKAGSRSKARPPRGEHGDPGKILVTPNRRSSNVYVPQEAMPVTRRNRTRGRSGTRSWRSQARPVFTRKQVIMGAAAVALILVLLIPFLIKANHTETTVSSNTPFAGSTQAVGFSGQPLPNHELIITPQDTDHPAPPVMATSAYLLDAGTGDTLYAYNPFMHLPMLSTTKLMTASLAIEQAGDHLDQRITITGAMNRDMNQLSADSALFGIKQGEIYTLRDLLYGLLFLSGNDAAIAIADALGGNLQNFVAEMNQKAQQLGMYDTHFMNPHGLLQTGQYSSAHDLSLLGKYSMSLPALHTISGANAYHIPQGGNHPERFLINENQFLWWYPGVDGGKTGYDGQSDFIQVMSVTRNHHHLVGVVMNTDNWWTDMRDLMNWGFDSFNWISPHDGDMQHPIPYDSLWNYFAKDTKDYTVPTADHGRYYVFTGFSITGSIMKYFDAHGGLKTFGYPTKMLTASSSSLISQQFEHGAIQCDLAINLCQKV